MANTTITNRGTLQRALKLTCRTCRCIVAYTAADLPALHNDAAATVARLDGWRKLGPRAAAYWHCPRCVARLAARREGGG